MPLPKTPGKSYFAMRDLISARRIRSLRDVFTDELILAICWEETLFNNVRQEAPGTAVGFGQNEPSEFWTLKSDGARARGYFVPNLPPTQKLGSGATIALAPLTDEQSVQVISAMLCHAFFNVSASLQVALESYAGVSYSRNLDKKVQEGKLTREKANALDPLGVQGRKEKIDGWRKCEQILRAMPANGGVDNSRIRAALMAARGYPAGEAWDKILFPQQPEGPNTGGQ
jgi:hypothetical protein